MFHITEVKVAQNYRLALTFSDGASGEVDLSHLVGHGAFTAWEDLAFFQEVRIDPQGGLLWGDAIDLCPDALYFEATGKRPEDVFPDLQMQGHA